MSGQRVELDSDSFIKGFQATPLAPFIMNHAPGPSTLLDWRIAILAWKEIHPPKYGRLAKENQHATLRSRLFRHRNHRGSFRIRRHRGNRDLNRPIPVRFVPHRIRSFVDYGSPTRYLGPS